MLKNICDVSILVLLKLVVSLSLHHKLTEVSILGRNEGDKIIILEHVRPLVLFLRNRSSEALFSELGKECL